MSTIKQFVAIETIATMIAAKILGRTISSVQRGFAEDPELPAQLSVYRAIQDQYPDSTVTVKEMFDSMVSRAEQREKSNADKISGLTEAQKEMFGAEDSLESAELLAAIPAVLDLLIAAPADYDAWKEMPVVAQWAILSSVERTLPTKAPFYRKKGGANFLNLAAQCEAAEPKFYALITKYLATKLVSDQLELARESGINVPESQSAAA